MRIIFILIYINFYFAFSQNINLNNEFNYNQLRNSILIGKIKTNYSLNIRPINANSFTNHIQNHKVILNHCVAEYPCKNENLRLGNISKMKELWGSEKVRIGYSGHEEGIMPSVAAAVEGAEVIERHFCLSRDSFVHHIECSLEPEEFKLMVDSIKNKTHTREDLERWLGEEAYSTGFSMSEMEKSFLLHNKYGNDYLTGK